MGQKNIWIKARFARLEEKKIKTHSASKFKVHLEKHLLFDFHHSNSRLVLPFKSVEVYRKRCNSIFLIPKLLHICFFKVSNTESKVLGHRSNGFIVDFEEIYTILINAFSEKDLALFCY